MRVRVLERVVLPEVMANGPHAEAIAALVDEMRAIVAKAKGVPVENLMVEIALAKPPEHKAVPGRVPDKFKRVGNGVSPCLEERNARIKRGIHAALAASRTQCPAVAAPPFKSIRLPKGVILSYVREDGSIVTTLNVESDQGHHAASKLAH